MSEPQSASSGGQSCNCSARPLATFLSKPAEWHALVHGMSRGARTRSLGPEELPDIEDVQDQPHYYRGGYIIGTLLQFGLLLAILNVSLGWV